MRNFNHHWRGFQLLWSLAPSSLIRWRQKKHPATKTCFKFLGIDNFLMVTKWDCDRVVHGSLFFDPTRQNVDPTRDCRQKVWPDPTLLYMNYVWWVQLSSFFNVSRGWKKDLEWPYYSRPWSRGNKNIANIRCYREVHSMFNLSRSKQGSLNSFYPATFKQTSQSARPNPMNIYECSIASTSYISRQSWSWSWIIWLEPTKSLDQTGLTNKQDWVRIRYGY